MEICHHVLYKSEIYSRPDEAQMTYVHMMDVSTYLNKLLANDALNNELVKNFQAVERILSHPACKVVRQTKIDFDLIKVCNGFCFSTSKRAFVLRPIPSTQLVSCHLGRSHNTTAQNRLDPDTLNKVWLIPFRTLKSVRSFSISFTNVYSPLKCPKRQENLFSQAHAILAKRDGAAYFIESSRPSA